MRKLALVAMVLLLVGGACKKKDGGSTAAEDTFTAATNAATGAANLVATASGAANCPPAPECPAAPACPTCAVCADPNALGKADLGADPTTLKVPAPPGFTFTVEKAGEYQIDAVSPDNDPLVLLYKDAERIGRDDDGGEDHNARLFAFLTPGTYTARVADVDWAAMDAKVQVAAAPAIAVAGTIKPGESLDVSAPEGESNRASSGEATLEIEAAGKYRIDADAPEDNDASMVLIRDNAVVAENDDGDGVEDAHDSRIEADLEPGTYTIRVFDRSNDAATIKVTAAAL